MRKMIDDTAISKDLEWLLELSDQYRESLTAILNSVKNIEIVVPDDYTYFHVRTRHIDDLIERSLREGRVDIERHAPTSLPDDFKYTKEHWLEYANQQGNCLRLFVLLKVTRAAALRTLVNDGLELLCKGHVTPAFLCFRSSIEIVASFVQTLEEVSKFRFSANQQDARETNSSLYNLLVQRVFGRRIDWSLVLSEQPTSLTSKKSISYKEKALTVDQAAEGILDQIDFLKKKVLGARKVYELLSEFAHPNTGVFLAHRVKSCHRSDLNGQSWEESAIGLSSPPDIFEDMKGMFEQVFLTIRDCLIQFEKSVSNDHEVLRELITQNSKMLTREILEGEFPVLDSTTKIVDLFDPDSWCPCASGDRVKYCCGMKSKE